ncbi:MAG: hypothetical protein V8T45_01585 [Oscillospiraceae bacterium]
MGAGQRRDLGLRHRRLRRRSGRENGYCDIGSDVTVSLPGGDLTVNYSPEKFILTGSAIKVYRGTFEY